MPPIECAVRPCDGELPYIVKWPEHGTPEEQAAAQAEIDAHEAAGQMVFVIRRAGDYRAMIDHFL